MKESVNIANRFADAYLVAMLEHTDATDVIRGYEITYPELGDTFRTQAKELELLYGYVRTTELPSNETIASAYTALTSNFAPAPAIRTTSQAPASLRSRIAAFFSNRPIVAGASVAVVLTAVIAIIIAPWSQNNIDSSTIAQNNKGITAPVPGIPGNSSGEIAQGEVSTPSDNQIMPTPTFRGSDQNGLQDKDKLDRKDRERLAKLQAMGALTAPTGLKIASQTDEAIVVQWNKVPNALSYIIEIKTANAPTFKAVTQTSQTQARLTGLPTSPGRVEVRVIAASGERTGEPSAAMTVSVP